MMEFFTVLLITFMLGGSPMNIGLTSTSAEACLEDMQIVEIVVTALNGTDLDMSCVTRRQ
jgi:hypothetical protein